MDMENVQDRLVGFMGGNIITTLTTIITGAEVAKVLILGLIGGLAGMLAKDIYNYLKRKINGKDK
jgi:CDP-diglyceride synthetase